MATRRKETGKRFPIPFPSLLLISALLAIIALALLKPCPIHPLLSFCADTKKALSETDGTYLACGCGCCGGTEPRIKCASEQEISKIILDDRAIASSPSCAMMGCSMGTLYKVC